MGIILSFSYFFFFYKISNKDLWYKDTTFIGHALYGIDNNDYTNSYEALEEGYQKGIRVMEADFLLTTDNKVILLHTWEEDSTFQKRSTYEQFMNTKIKNQYSPLDLETLLEIMKKYKDLYIIIDTKEGKEDDDYQMANIYSQIVERCKKYDPKLLDRFIVQIYDFQDYKMIKKIYNFSSYIFTTYKMGKLSFQMITYFCLLNNIETIAVPIEYIKNDIMKEEDITFIKKKNIKIYIYTINDLNTFQELQELGVDGVYTDYLYEKN